MNREEKGYLVSKVLTYVKEFFEDRGLENNIYSIELKKDWEGQGEAWYLRVGNFKDAFFLFVCYGDTLVTERKNPSGFNILEEAIVEFVSRLNSFDSIDFMNLSQPELIDIIENVQKSFWVRWATELPALPNYLENKLIEEGIVIRG